MMAAYSLSTLLTDRSTSKRMFRMFEQSRAAAVARANEGPFSADELYAANSKVFAQKKKENKATTCEEKATKNDTLNDFWISGFGDFASQNAQDQTPGFNFNTAGVVLGYDSDSTEAKRVGLDVATFGVAGAYTHTSIHNHGHAGHASTDTANIALYGNAYFDEWFLQLAMWNGYAHIKNKRNISYTGYSQKAKSSHNAYQGDLHAGAGYDFNFFKGYTAGTIEPFVAFDWVFDLEQAYSERGTGVYDMHIKRRFSSMLRTEIGFNNYFGWNFSWGDLIFRDKVSYVNKSPFSVGNVSAQIISAPSFFTVSTFTENQNLFSPSAEFIWKGSNDCYGSLLYEGEFGAGYVSNEIIAKVGIYF
jgi:hypothetical protein